MRFNLEGGIERDIHIYIVFISTFLTIFLEKLGRDIDLILFAL